MRNIFAFFAILSISIISFGSGLKTLKVNIKYPDNEIKDFSFSSIEVMKKAPTLKTNLSAKCTLFYLSGEYESYVISCSNSKKSFYKTIGLCNGMPVIFILEENDKIETIRITCDSTENS